MGEGGEVLVGGKGFGLERQKRGWGGGAGWALGGAEKKVGEVLDLSFFIWYTPLLLPLRAIYAFWLDDRASGPFPERCAGVRVRPSRANEKQ